MVRDALLKVTILLVIVLNLLSSVFILYQTESTIRAATAQALSSEGTVTFCINNPPVIGVPCNASLSQDIPYTCQLTATDAQNSSLSFFLIPVSPNVSIFNVSTGGLISFTPTNDDRGNHSIIFGVDDNSLCENAYDYEPFNFSVGNVNDPPYLISAIPSQEFNVNTTLFAFYLDDYFDDPDGDALSYTFLRGVSDVTINITLNPDSSVTFTASDCGKGHFQFIATDPGNLSANSNAIQVEVVCPEEADDGDTDGDSSGGGGGGGAGVFSCEPELVCFPWSDCYPNGLQVQVCKDKNGCDDNEVKFYRDCYYQEEQPSCEENWICSDWSVCSEQNVQNRSCYDLGSCGTETFLPPLQQDCLYLPTCEDGVQNGDETAVDCGGSCAACPSIQQPSLLPEAGFFATFWAFLVIVLLSVLLSLFILYRERIYEGLAELGWLLARQRRKEILLSQGEKRALFERINSLGGLPEEKRYEGLSIVVRTYLGFVYDLPFEFTSEELAKANALPPVPLSSDLSMLLKGFSSRLDLLESGKLKGFNRTLYASILEEQRLLICMTSEYAFSEIEREIEERKITDELTFVEEIRLRLLNAWEALQFRETELARDEYISILRAYENLPLDWRNKLYPDLQRLYAEISYVHETSGEIVRAPSSPGGPVEA